VWVFQILEASLPVESSSVFEKPGQEPAAKALGTKSDIFPRKDVLTTYYALSIRIRNIICEMGYGLVKSSSFSIN
jgi:hypothetical protein